LTPRNHIRDGLARHFGHQTLNGRNALWRGHHDNGDRPSIWPSRARLPPQDARDRPPSGTRSGPCPRTQGPVRQARVGVNSPGIDGGLDSTARALPGANINGRVPDPLRALHQSQPTPLHSPNAAVGKRHDAVAELQPPIDGITSLRWARSAALPNQSACRGLRASGPCVASQRTRPER
jgi:hypothetical protein